MTCIGNPRIGAGDLPVIPIGPIESYHNEDVCSATPIPSRAKGKAIEAQFLFQEIIGSGGFSKVKKATHKKTGETYAIKVVDKSKIEGENVPRIIFEIETLASVRHPSICKLYSAFYTTSRIYMVMECCMIDLFEYLVKLTKPIPESQARELFIQLLSAVSYLHSVRIVHRDIKPENILLTEKMKLRLSDFGFAAKVPESRNYFLSTYCGSLAYSAPEVITGVPYCGIKADTWSLGVNLYVLLTNKQPFYSNKVNELRAQIISGRFPLPRHLRKKSINLIKRFLQLNPLDRTSLEEVWKDSWLEDGNMSEDFFQLYYSYHQYNFDGFGNPSCWKREKERKASLFWGVKPTCRSEPVQVEKRARGRAILHQFCHSVRKIFLRCGAYVVCCKV